MECMETVIFLSSRVVPVYRSTIREREGGRKGTEGGREGGREGGMEGGRDGGREGGREGGRTEANQYYKTYETLYIND